MRFLNKLIKYWCLSYLYWGAGGQHWHTVDDADWKFIRQLSWWEFRYQVWGLDRGREGFWAKLSDRMGSSLD